MDNWEYTLKWLQETTWLHCDFNKLYSPDNVDAPCTESSAPVHFCKLRRSPIYDRMKLLSMIIKQEWTSCCWAADTHPQGWSWLLSAGCSCTCTHPKSAHTIQRRGDSRFCLLAVKLTAGKHVSKHKVLEHSCICYSEPALSWFLKDLKKSSLVRFHWLCVVTWCICYRMVYSCSPIHILPSHSLMEPIICGCGVYCVDSIVGLQ